MSGWRRMKLLAATLLGGLLLQPVTGWACAICYGEPESPMAQGLNWGIFVLLTTVMLVLGGIAGFFIFLARRSAAMASSGSSIQSTDRF